MTEKLKIGDRVKVLRRHSGTPESAVGKTYTIKREGGFPEFGLDVPGATGCHDLWWYDASDLELVQDHRKSARILTEKILVNGTPCRKIWGFEGILGRDELPKKYLAGDLMFYNEGTHAGHGHFEFDGEKLQYLGCDKITTIGLRFPVMKPPELDIEYIPMLNEGDIWPESTFQNILVWMKRAGSCLAKIRTQEKAAWSGKETVEI